jgi:hypothetical protein
MLSAMESQARHVALVPPTDGRQSETALAIARGTAPHCDRLFFAFTQDLPCEIFPGDTGLIVADAYGAHMHCEAPEHRLPAPTRKSMMLRFAMAAAQRINRLVDPQGHGEF